MNADASQGIVLAESPTAPLKLTGWPRVIHWAIIINFGIQMVYASWQVFVVMQPPGHMGPMFGAATDMPFEMMMIRRMYALEGWVAFGGLAFYVALTEILPRRRA